MNVSEVKKKVKDKRIQEIMWKIDHHQVKDDDEWIQIAKEMKAYIKTDIPEDVKRLFYPLGYLEMTSIIIDGINRWRNSICSNCERKLGKYRCEIYPKDRGDENGIPNEIWARPNGKCSYYK